jgi:NitT/TauT family transport system substrate-binding protein
VTVVTLNIDQMLPALTNGSVDAALMFGTVGLEGQRQKAIKPLIYVDDMYPNAVSGIWVFSPSFVTRTEVAKRWMVEYVRGVRDYNDALFKGQGKAALIDALVKYTPLKDRTWYDVVNWQYLDPNAKIDAQKLAEEQDWLNDHGFLDGGKVGGAAVVDTQFAEYAVQQLGPYQ